MSGFVAGADLSGIIVEVDTPEAAASKKESRGIKKKKKDATPSPTEKKNGYRIQRKRKGVVACEEGDILEEIMSDYAACVKEIIERSPTRSVHVW